MARVKVDFEGLNETLAELQKIGTVIQEDIAGSVKRAGMVVRKRAKQLVPRPGQAGYQGYDETHSDQRGTKLKDSINIRLVKYANATVVVVGTDYGTGRHGHLVEHGHRVFSQGQFTGIWAPEYEFLGPAAEETKEQQRQAFAEWLKKKTQARYGST